MDGKSNKASGSRQPDTSYADNRCEPLVYQDGMVVEVYEHGQWKAGEVTHLYDDRPNPCWYASYFGEYGTSGDLSEAIVRQSSSANKQAVHHYEQQIKDYQAIIDHDQQHRIIAELHAKIAGIELVATDRKPSTVRKSVQTTPTKNKEEI